MSAFAKDNPNLVFLNLRESTGSLKQSTDFFTSGLGLPLQPAFSNDSTSCIQVTSTVYLMLHSAAQFATWLPEGKAAADTRRQAEMMCCLSSGSREGVDELVEKAVKAGGRPDPNKIGEMEGMYGRSFEDLDGHIWEVCWMDMKAHEEYAAKEGHTGQCQGA